MGTRLPRVFQKIFASPATNNGIFGSAQDSGGVIAADIEEVMSLPAWLSGWVDAIVGSSKYPPLEEFQSHMWVHSQQLAYLLQQGIAEYDDETTYYVNNICAKAGTYELYGSITNDNVGNALSDGANWLFLGDLSDLAGLNSSNGGGLENYLTNGQFRWWQEFGLGSTSHADDTYFADQWYVLTQSGAVATIQQTLQSNGIPQNVRVTQSQASAQRFGVAQIVLAGDSQKLRAQAAAMAAQIRCSSSQAIRYAILEWTGTANAVTSDFVNDWTSGSYTAGGFFLGSNITVTEVGVVTPAANTWTATPDITDTISSSCNNAIVFIWTEQVAAQNVTLDIGNWLLRRGTATGNYPFIPDEIELVRSAQFIKKSFDPDQACVQNLGDYNGALGVGQCVAASTASFMHAVNDNIAFWAIPSVTLYNPSAANAQIRGTANNADCTNSAVIDIGMRGFRTGATSPAGTVPGDGLQVHYLAKKYL